MEPAKVGASHEPQQDPLASSPSPSSRVSDRLRTQIWSRPRTPQAVNDRDSHRESETFWQEDDRTPQWAVIVASLIVIGGVIAAIAIYASRESGASSPVARAISRDAKAVGALKEAPVPREHPASVVRRGSMPPATRDTAGPESGFLGPNAEASFQSLESSLPAHVGLAVAPLGGAEARQFGGLAIGHAWSTIKVPILATLLREHQEALRPKEEGWATSAITASDNEAAASLFGLIEGAHGGLVGGSRAVERVLHEAGSPSTVVATAPPPPGAVSTYGQTEWSLQEAAQFFASLGRCGVLGPAGTSYVESLMESVIPEQRWGLGEAGFPPGWRVAMKGGWGPEAESGDSYLVRQSGIVQNGKGGVAVAMMAMDESGTYSAGAADLTKIGQWLARELKGLGPSYPSCTAG